MRDESEHDEIGVLSVNAMARVGLVAGGDAHFADVLHDFVFAFAGNVVSGENDGEVVPEGVFFDFFANEVLNDLGDFGEEFRAGCDAVGIKDVGFTIFLFG